MSICSAQCCHLRLRIFHSSESSRCPRNYRCFKIVKDWTIDTDGPKNNKAFFDRITKDIGVWCVVCGVWCIVVCF
jgi:hypothetical protein